MIVLILDLCSSAIRNVVTLTFNVSASLVFLNGLHWDCLTFELI